MKIAYFDCVGGVSGDMCLSALFNVGVSLEQVVPALRSLPLGDWDIELVEKEVGVAKIAQAKVTAKENHAHRHLSHIETIINDSNLTAKVKQNALAVFRKLALAESAVHGEPLEKLHFHEVGSDDAVIDIAGVCLALDVLGIEQLYCSPLPIGRGVVECAHGVLPLPAPAVVELLKNTPTYGVDAMTETVTPTGAALMTTLASAFGPQPAMRWDIVGCGPGTHQSNLPNILRVFIGETLSSEDEIWTLETNLDDVSPEIIGYTTERLLESGAMDVFTTAVQMKKGRPGVLITVLAEYKLLSALENLLFVETGTFGVRKYPVKRTCLTRKWINVETEFGAIRVKEGIGDNGVVNYAPEYEDCKAAALNYRASLNNVYTAALKAYQDYKVKP